MRVDEDPRQAHPDYFTSDSTRTGDAPGPVETDDTGAEPGTTEHARTDDEVTDQAADEFVERTDQGEFPADGGHPDAVESSAGPLDRGDGMADEPAVGVASVPPPGDNLAEESAVDDNAHARDDLTAPDAIADRAGAAEYAAEEARDTGTGTGTAADVAPAAETAREGVTAPETETEPETATDTATETEAEAERTELTPGAVPAATAVFWETTIVDGFRDRWQQIQLRFVDDPRNATEQAQGLAGDVCQQLTDALSRHREELDRWQNGSSSDTEELRVALRRYRDLLDRLFAI